jgi:hypothetical protein
LEPDRMLSALRGEYAGNESQSDSSARIDSCVVALHPRTHTHELLTHHVIRLCTHLSPTAITTPPRFQRTVTGSEGHRLFVMKIIKSSSKKSSAVCIRSVSYTSCFLSLFIPYASPCPPLKP